MTARAWAPRPKSLDPGARMGGAEVVGVQGWSRRAKQWTYAVRWTCCGAELVVGEARLQAWGEHARPRCAACASAADADERRRAHLARAGRGPGAMDARGGWWPSLTGWAARSLPGPAGKPGSVRAGLARAGAAV